MYLKKDGKKTIIHTFLTSYVGNTTKPEDMLSFKHGANTESSRSQSVIKKQYIHFSIRDSKYKAKTLSWLNRLKLDYEADEKLKCAQW